MPPDRLILHIGTQKTASTMVRRFLKTNSDVLARHDIRLVDRPTLTESVFFAHLEKISRGQSDGATVPKEVAESLQGMVQGPQHTALATSEIMFRRLPLEDFYQNIGAGLAFIRRILPGTQVEVILYVRQQKSFIESCYTQMVQVGRDTRFEDYIGGTLPAHLNWALVCDDIAAAIDRENLHVRPFEVIRTLGSEGFLHDFLSLTGLPETAVAEFSFDEALADGKAANRGFSQVAVDIARFTMPKLAPKNRRKLRKFLQENYSTGTYPRPVYFTPEQSKALAALYADSNARLFAEYMPDEDPAACGYL